MTPRFISPWRSRCAPFSAPRRRRQPSLEPLEGRELLSGTLPTVSIDAVPYDGADNTIASIFHVRLSAPSTSAVSVTYATADGTTLVLAGQTYPGALANRDYVPISPTTLIFAPGQTDLLVSVVGYDEYGELDHVPVAYYTVNLSNPVSATLASGHTSGNAFIYSDPDFAHGHGVGDPTKIPGLSPFVTMNPSTVTASANGTTTATFNVRLSHPYYQTLAVPYATGDGTASAGADYVAVPTSYLTFLANETEQSITVTIKPEPAGGGTKTFTVNLLNTPGPATAGTADFIIQTNQVVGTIITPVGSPSPTPTTPAPTPTTPTPTPTTPTPTPTTPTPTPTTPTPTPATSAPTFTVAMRTTSGKGRKKIPIGHLTFSAALDSESAENSAHYHVTQKISKKKIHTIAVLAAKYGPSDNSVTLMLGKPKPGKALQVTVSGLVGADGTPVRTFVTSL